MSIIRAMRCPVVDLDLRFDPPDVLRETPFELTVAAGPGSASGRRTVPIAPGTVLSVNLRSGSRVRTLHARFSREEIDGRYRFPCDGLPRGLYYPENVHLAIPDPFRVSVVTPRCILRDSVLRVLPRVHQISIALDMHGAGQSVFPEHLDRVRGGEYVDVRPYIPGDDINRLNWNMYAHTGELFLRIPEELPPPLRAVVVIADAVQETNAVLDRIIETALGLAEALEKNSHQVVLAIMSADVPVIVGTMEHARRAFAAADHHHRFVSMESTEIGNCGSIETGEVGRLLVTTGLSRRCPPSMRGEWVVLIPMEGSEGEARRLAPLDSSD
jgi:uncharacterized protein (DUF58 family)